jgi:ketosteroid isomerase-like protein
MQSARTILVLVALCANFAAVPCFGQDAGPSPKEAIQGWAKALTSKDPADVLRFYAESEDLIVIFSSGHQIKGYAVVKKLYDDSARRIAFYESEVTEVAVQRLADVAWVACRHRARYRDLTDDSKWQLEIRTTFVLKRHKDGWRIVLEHSSPIADVPRVNRLQ